MSGPYCLRKDAHCNTVLDQLFQDNTFADVTLTAEGRSIKAHKSVLSLASSYFQQVLWKEPNIQSVIVFRDIEFSELKNLIKFIYTGEAIIDAQDLRSFMSTAKSLEILSLCEPQTDNLSDNEEAFSESGKRLADSTNSPLSKSKRFSRSSVSRASIPATSIPNEKMEIKSEPVDFTEDALRMSIKNESQLPLHESFDLDHPSTSLHKFDSETDEMISITEKENISLQERLASATNSVCERQWMTIEEAANSCGLSFARTNNLSLPSENSSDESQISPSLTFARGRIYPSPAQESLKKLIIRTEMEVREMYAKMEANLGTLEDRIELELKQNALTNYKKLLRSKINAARRSMKSRERRKRIRDGVVKSMATSKAC